MPTDQGVAAASKAFSAPGADNLDTFAQCADKSIPTAIVAEGDLGSELGPGIAEVVDSEIIAQASAGTGLNIPPSTYAFRYLDDGAIYALDAQGTPLLQMSEATGIIVPSTGSGASSTESGRIAANRGVIPTEAKRIIEACLGFGIGGAGGFEAFVRQFDTVQKAAKFVIRRFGIIGAVSCAGGVIWRYV